MTDTNTIFDDIFEQAKQQVIAAVQAQETSKAPALSSDPITDIKTRQEIRIPYTRKVKQNRNSAFMEFKRADRNWITTLIYELSRIQYGHPLDATLMFATSLAKRQSGEKQNWTQFFEGVHHDKVIKGMDFSESQLRHVTTILHDLTTNGYKLNGGGLVVFYDIETGEELL